MDKILIVLSGGQDSTTVLAWAKSQFGEVHAVTFDYGQTHIGEVEAAKKVASMIGVESHEVIEVGPVLKGTSPLVNRDTQVQHYKRVTDMPDGIEPTFIPGRNLLFLVIAANRAAVLGINNIALGVCEADFGGYPDCRQRFVDMARDTINEAIFGLVEPGTIVIHTPLMKLTKAQTIKLAQSLPGAMDALAFTLTSYDGDYPPNPRNHSSILRARGFHEAGASDPLIERAIAEGELPVDWPKDNFIEGTIYDDFAAGSNFHDYLEGFPDENFRKDADPTPTRKTVVGKKPKKAEPDTAEPDRGTSAAQ